MNKTVKLLTIIVIILLVTAALPSPAGAAETMHSGYCGEDAYFTLDSDGVLTITGYGVVIDNPWLEWKDDVTRLYVSDGITEIDEFIFSDHANLTEVTITAPVRSIGEGAFMDCAAMSVITLPYGLKTMGGNVFNGCAALNHVTVPDTVTEIGNAVFSYSGIESVSLPLGITRISGSMFCNCDNLKSVTIPYGVTYLQSSSFDDCDSLEAVDIPYTVTKIEDHVFCKCTSLKSVYISANITNIDEGNFAECASLTSINVSPSNPNYSSDDRGVFFNKSKSRLIQAPGGLDGWYSMPDSVTAIDLNAFEQCDSLTGISFSSHVTEIPGHCFYGCDSLADVRIHSGINTIGYGAFNGCTSLRTIDIPTSIRTIGDGAFCESGLETVFIPSSVNSIGELAFYNCKNLTAIHCSDYNSRYWSDGVALYDVSGTHLIHVPAGLTGSYTVRSDVDRVEYRAFGGCDKLKAIYFQSNAPVLGDNCFEGVTAVILYPQGYSSWNDSNLLDYGGNITWRPYNPDDPMGGRPIGDIDFDFAVTNSDLVTLARYLVGLYDGTEAVMAADMDGSGKIDNGDLVLLARKLIGAIQ